MPTTANTNNKANFQTPTKALSRAAQGKLQPRRLGAAYGRRRWPDLLLTLLATDLLVRIFSNRSPWLLPLRGLALTLLARFRRLRRLTLAVMSTGVGAIQDAPPD